MYSLVLGEFAHIYKEVSQQCDKARAMLVFFLIVGMLG